MVQSTIQHVANTSSLCYCYMLVIHNQPHPEEADTKTIHKYHCHCSYLIGSRIISVRHTKPIRHNNHYTNHLNPTEETVFLAKLRSEPQRTRKRYKATVEIYAVEQAGKWLSTSGKALVYYDTSITLHNGYKIVADADLTDIPETVHEFKYRKFMQRKGVYKQAFIERDMLIVSDSLDKTGDIVMQLRGTINNILNSGDFDEEKLNILKALVLGDRKAPSERTETLFRTAGITHLLRISGLHVGIVALIVGLLLRPFRRNRFSSTMIGAVEIAFVWLFVAITGMAPSTMRAGVMFTFIIVGKSLTMKPPTLNGVAASALLLLTLQPSVIADIGFQLSYSSVVGIIVFVPPLKKYAFSNRHDVFNTDRQTSSIKRNLAYWAKQITRKFCYIVYDCIIVCIVAQICTLPLTLYYFHQFALYFLIANVLIIPFLGIILGCIILMLLAHHWNWAWVTMQDIVSWQLDAICNITEWVSHLPHALIENINFDIPMLIVAYGALVCAGIALSKRDAHHDVVTDNQ